MNRTAARSFGLARYSGQRVRHPIPKQCAVGEAGERIVKCLVLELVLQPLPIGDVAEIQHDASNRGLVQQVLPNRLDPSPRAVRVPDSHLRRLRRTVNREEPIQHRLHEPAIVQMDLPLEEQADARRRVMSQDPMDGVGLVRDLTA